MAKVSENTINVVNYLKENQGKNLTSADVAEALGISTQSVNGVVTSLHNKGLCNRVEATVTGAADISFLTITEKGKEADLKDISENGQKIMAYLKEVEGQNVTADDATAALGLEKRKFTGTFNGLVKKELAARVTAKVEAPVTVKYLVLTDEGMAYDPTASAE